MQEAAFGKWESSTVLVNKDGVKPQFDSPSFVKPGRTQSTMNVPDRKAPRRKKKTKKLLPGVNEPIVETVAESRFLDKDNLEHNSNGLTSHEAQELLAKVGYNEVVSAKESFGWTILKMYVQPINILVLIAAILSVAVTPEPIETPLVSTLPQTLATPERGWLSFGLLLLLLNLFVWSDYFAEKNAGDAVAVLKGKLKPVATAKRDGEWVEVPVRELVPGDLLMFTGGSSVPADVTLLHVAGEHLEVDESALTGESLPSKKRAGDESLSGGMVKVGEAQAVVLRTGKDSFFGKTISLLNEGGNSGHLHMLLMRTTYVITGVAAAFSIGFLVLLLVRQSYYNTFPNLTLGPGSSIAMAFGLLASAMPLAIPVVTGAILAVGAKELADIDVIVSRMSCLEELAGCSILCSDKTGTLTLNQLVMEKDYYMPDKRFTEKDLLVYAGLASGWVKCDAIDKCIMDSLKERTSITPADLEKEWKIWLSTPFNAVTKRTEADVTQIASGVRMLVSKGAPQVIQKLTNGGDELTDITNSNAKRGFRTLGVAYRMINADGSVNEEQPWVFVGYFALFDPPRVDSKDVLATAMRMGLHVKMITGDQNAIAEETMARLGMGRKAVHRDVLKSATNKLELIELIESTAGFSGVFPEDKFSIVEGFQFAHHKVAMTGDGVNDAPALRKANVGVAVDGATDAAKAAADIIMLTPGLSGIVTALTRSRKIFHRLDSYLIFRIAVSIDIAVFYFLAAAAMHFIVPTYVIVLTALINDIIMISMSFDYVTASPLPVDWNIAKVITISCLISFFCIGQSLLFVYLARPVGPYGVSWWTYFGSKSITDYQVIAALFLEMNTAIQLSIFSARTEGPFWIRRPGAWLLAAVFLGCLTSTLIAALWTINASLDLGDGALMDGLYDGKTVLLIYLYCIFWFLAMEVFKTITYVIWEKIQFHDDAHFKQFFHVTGWSKSSDGPAPHATSVPVGGAESKADVVMVDSSKDKKVVKDADAVELGEMKEVPIKKK